MSYFKALVIIIGLVIGMTEGISMEPKSPPETNTDSNINNNTNTGQETQSQTSSDLTPGTSGLQKEGNLNITPDEHSEQSTYQNNGKALDKNGKETTISYCDLGEEIFIHNESAFQNRLQIAVTEAGRKYIQEYDHTMQCLLSKLTKKEYDNITNNDISPILAKRISDLNDENLILNNNRHIYLLYKEPNKLKDTKILMKNLISNKIGKQLLLDICIENNMKKRDSPVFIIMEEEVINELPNINRIGELICPSQANCKEILTEAYREDAPLFMPKDSNIPINVILYKTPAVSNYHGVYNRTIKSILNKKSVGTTRLIEIKFEDHCSLFHELNHYRHHLQGINIETSYIDASDKNVIFPFHEIEITCTINPMFSPEEELQLTGYTKTKKEGELFDFINEIAYRYFSSLPIRLLYYCLFSRDIYISYSSVRLMINRAMPLIEDRFCDKL